jgi:hypothetical protein
MQFSSVLTELEQFLFAGEYSTFINFYVCMLKLRLFQLFIVRAVQI